MTPCSVLSQHVCHSLHHLNSVGPHTRLPEYDHPSNLPAPSRMKTADRASGAPMWAVVESFPHVKPQRLQRNRRSRPGMYEGLTVAGNHGALDAQTGLFSFSSFLCAFSTVFVPIRKGTMFYLEFLTQQCTKQGQHSNVLISPMGFFG